MLHLSDRFSIGSTPVSFDSRCYVIAEAGSNHNQDIETALRLIDIAADAGADAVKFQCFSADTIVANTDHPLTRIQFAGATRLHELYKKSEMPREWLKTLREHADQREITFLSTPFDEHAVDDLMEVGVEAFKIASFELNHFPLLRHIASTGRPLLLSTGMATLDEIAEALDVFASSGGSGVGLFHCGIGYPMSLDEVNLRAMDTLKTAFNCPVGYSDHTLGIEVPTAAAARGACFVEKHFTTSRQQPGPDHSFAIEPDELRAMVQAIRVVEKILGSCEKGPVESELIHKLRGRRSLFFSRAISKGETITADMIAILRPGAGLHPRHLEMATGMKAARDLQKHEPVTWECLST